MNYTQAKQVNMEAEGGGGTAEVMKGATATTDGRAGSAPQPKAGQETLFLRGDATWAPAQGEKGQDGKDGKDGADGFSPTLKETPTDDGYNIEITDKDGSRTIALQNGADGVTPDLVMEVNVDNTTGTPAVEVTKSGTKQRQVFNLQFSGLKGEQGVEGAQGEKGEDGKDGAQGKDGITPDITMEVAVDDTSGTPSATVTRRGELATPIYKIDFSGLKGYKGDAGKDGSNGKDGKDGSDGFTPTIATKETDDGYDITITNKTGSQTISVKNGEDGTVGTTPDISATASVDNNVGTPSVTVTKSGEILTPNFDFAFKNIKGQKGDKGDTPTIGASATVGAGTGTPSVKVTKGGTTASPSFAFAFDNLKGSAGNDGFTPSIATKETDDGYDITITNKTGSETISITNGIDGTEGATPAITATASVDNNTGTPSVTVTKSGAIKTPNFDFAFKNIKGKDGTDGVSPTLSETKTSDGYNISITDKNGTRTVPLKNGDDGITPNISASASVTNTTGTPSVNVTKGGTTTNPSFAFAFNNLKGEKGDTGTGYSVRTYNGGITGTSCTISNIKPSDGVKAGDVLIDQRPDTATGNLLLGFWSITSVGTTTASVTKISEYTIEKGAQGIQGIQGETGVAGKDGDTYTPKIGTITTVDAFDKATAKVTVDKDAKTAIFDFGIPKGEKGDSGASGINILRYTMSMTSWVDNEYSFESSFPFASYNLQIEPNGDLITEQQLKAWNEGQLVGSFTANKCIAMGNVPTTDIPIILKVQSKGA